MKKVLKAIGITLGIAVGFCIFIFITGYMFFYHTWISVAIALSVVVIGIACDIYDNLD